MTHSFLSTSLRAIIFLTGDATTLENNGSNFSSELTAIANSWQQGFANDTPFFYTMPSKSRTPRISKPLTIKGKSVYLKNNDWSEIEKFL